MNFWHAPVRSASHFGLRGGVGIWDENADLSPPFATNWTKKKRTQARPCRKISCRSLQFLRGWRSRKNPGNSVASAAFPNVRRVPPFLESAEHVRVSVELLPLSGKNLIHCSKVLACVRSGFSLTIHREKSAAVSRPNFARASPLFAVVFEPCSCHPWREVR